MIKKINEKQPAIGGTRELRDYIQLQWEQLTDQEIEREDLTRECRLCLLKQFMHKSKLGTV